MQVTTVSAFVSKLIATPLETSPIGDDRAWLPGYSSIEVHTGLGTFEIPWPHEDPLPPLGTTVQLSIEWETE